MNKFPTLFTFTYFHSLAGYCFVLQIFLLRRGVYLNLDSDNTLDLPNQPIFCHGYKQYLGVGGAGWLVCCWVPVLGNGNFISQGLFFYICPAFGVCVFTEIREYMEICRQVYSMRSYIAYLLYRLQSQSHPLEGVVVAVEVVAFSEFTKNNIVVILRNCGV